jgi:DNA modification methylase
MSDIVLTEEEVQTLLRCLNDRIEPPAELSKKLFPSLHAMFDFKTLKDSKIPTIEYQGKRSEAAILNEAAAFGGGSPLQLERYFEGGKISRSMNQLQLFRESKGEYEGTWRNLIVQGDNLQFLKTCYLNQDPIIKDKVKGKAKLVYIDPPFATKSDFAAKEGEDSYADRIDRAEFIEQLRERVIFLRELLANDGSIYVHLDQRMSQYVKIVMDEIFSGGNFLNEIVWMRSANTSSIGKIWKRAHDTVLNYSRSEDYIFNIQRKPLSEASLKLYTLEDGRGKYRLVPLLVSGVRNGETGKPWRGIDPNKRGRKGMHWVTKPSNLEIYDRDRLIVWPNKEDGAPNLKYYLDDNYGVAVTDFWDDIAPVGSGSSEFQNYPTQKPEALIERIILASSNPGDLVMDAFAGSGTTAAVAEKLGRRWIMCDFGKHAIYTMQKRMCMISESKELGSHGKKKEKYGEAPKPFCVVSVGAFDFQKIMNLRKNRDAYISFVMGIFGITERDDAFAAKYRVNNVCALKDGNPVEVYPVWDDEFLKNVRVDEDYLKGILAQSGGSLKGDYYIIAPETCVRVGETRMKNTRRERVTFKMLTFPYKVLEEVARNFSIEEQPSSPGNINKLISSVGFYFNEAVEVEIKRMDRGFKVIRFTTSILDREERRYEGLEGLAMLLIDSDYDEEKGFTVDTVIYQKDIKGDEVAAPGLTKKSAIIAIDKHGNESNVIKLG